ncbi:MAG TPA: 4a-hydroxytetrahydrobiopterin dehydratase [Thermoleophilia bacterium]|nr:4a-hydroxytetrahydrobiopterin dehydratase [Thermoleophilia bacterium]
MDKLNDQQRDAALERLDDWQAQGDAITRTFKLRDFARAIDFVNAVAEMAEEVQHHPDIDIRYNKVTITLTTHSAGGLTRNDIELAAGIDDIADAA